MHDPPVVEENMRPVPSMRVDLARCRKACARVSYIETTKMAGEDLLKPLDHTLTGEPPLASEVGKDDNENEDDEEESGKSKCTKGVIIGGMGEVQIVNAEMIREEEEAKANRKMLDLEIPNKSLYVLSPLVCSAWSSSAVIG